MRLVAVIGVVLCAIASASGVRALGGQAIARPPGPAEQIHWHPYQVPAGGRTGRVALVEIETWVDCGPCRKRDIAMDAVLSRYPRDLVAVVEHHYYPPFVPAFEEGARRPTDPSDLSYLS